MFTAKLLALVRAALCRDDACVVVGLVQSCRLTPTGRCQLHDAAVRGAGPAAESAQKPVSA